MKLQKHHSEMFAIIKPSLKRIITCISDFQTNIRINTLLFIIVINYFGTWSAETITRTKIQYYINKLRGAAELICTVYTNIKIQAEKAFPNAYNSKTEHSSLIFVIAKMWSGINIKERRIIWINSINHKITRQPTK